MTNKLKYSALLFLSVLFVLSSVQLYRLPLWSWWTLPFFLSFWGIIQILRSKRFSEKKELNHFGLATLSGLLLSFSFTGCGSLPILMWGAWVPILLVLDNLKSENQSVRKAWFYAYHTLVVWNIITTFWVANSILLPAFIAIFLNSLFMSVPILLYFVATKKTENRILSSLVLISSWLSFEFLHQRWEITWPWLQLGNAWSALTDWIQWYEFTGVPGGTLWILVINLLIISWLKSVLKRRTLGVATIAVAFIPVLFSYFLKFNHKDHFDKKANFLVVQPNFEPHYQKFEIPNEQQFRQTWQLIQPQLDSTIDLILLPETFVERVDENSLKSNSVLESMASIHSRFPNADWLLGADSYKILAQSEPSSRATRISKQDNSIRWELYNTAILLNDSILTNPIPVYHKSKFVPGAESMPYPFLFGFLKILFNKFGGTIEGLGSQEDREVFFQSKKSVGIAPVICFESIYGYYVANYNKNGTQIITIITNDGWWDDTPGYRQHFDFAKLRAIENRKWVVRSANTGTSGCINSLGEVVSKTKYNEPIALRCEVPVISGETFYTRFGDWISHLFLAIWSILIFWLFLGKKK